MIKFIGESGIHYNSIKEGETNILVSRSLLGNYYVYVVCDEVLGLYNLCVPNLFISRGTIVVKTIWVYT